MQPPIALGGRCWCRCLTPMYHHLLSLSAAAAAAAAIAVVVAAAADGAGVAVAAAEGAGVVVQGERGGLKGLSGVQQSELFHLPVGFEPTCATGSCQTRRPPVIYVCRLRSVLFRGGGGR